MSDEQVYNDLDNEYSRICGEILRTWSELETTMSLFLGGLLMTDDTRSRIVWMSMPNFRGRSDLLKRLAKSYLNEAASTEALRMINKAVSLSKLRNLIAHCQSGIDLQKKVTFLQNTDDDDVGVDLVGTKVYQLQNILGQEKEMRSLVGEFFRFGALRPDFRVHHEPKFRRKES